MQQKPELVKAFMKATLRSVAETIKDPAARSPRSQAAVDETDAKREAKVLEHTVALLAEQGDRGGRLRMADRASAGEIPSMWRASSA